MAVSTNTLTINGVNSGDFGLLLTSDTWLNAPEIGYEAYQIPRRSGDLIRRENRMGNIVRRFELFTKGANARQNVEAFRKVIYTRPFGEAPRWSIYPNYSKIETSYDPNAVAYGYLVGDAEVEPFLSGDALSLKMTLTFSCVPRKIGKTYDQVTPAPYHDYCAYWGGIYRRGDPEIKALLKGTPLEYEHLADRFVAFRLFESPTTGLGSSSATYTTTNWNYTDSYFMAFAYKDANGNFALNSSNDYTTAGSIASATRNRSAACEWYLIVQADMLFGTITRKIQGQTSELPLDAYRRSYTKAEAVGYMPYVRAWFNLNASNTNWQNSAIVVRGTSAGPAGSTYQKEITNFFGVRVIRWDLMETGTKQYLANNAVTKNITIDDVTVAGAEIAFGDNLWTQGRPYIQLRNKTLFFLDPYLDEWGTFSGEAEKVEVAILGAQPGYVDYEGNIARGQIIEQRCAWIWWKV